MLIDKSQNAAYVKLDSIDTPKGTLTTWQSTQSIDDQWDDFLASTPLGHFYQTSMWAQVRMLDGWQPLITIITLDDMIIGGFQMLWRSKSYLGKIGLVLKGPVVMSDDPVTMNFVITTLKKIARVNKIKALIVQPPDRDKVITHILRQSDFAANHVDYVIKENTVVIDLRKDETDILKSMRSDKRKNINKASRSAIQTREGDENDLKTFFKLMIETCKRQQVSPSPSSEEFFIKMWGLFSRHGHIKLFIAQHKDIDVSAKLVVSFGDTAYLWKTGWSGLYRNSHANEILLWEVFKWAKANGFSFADMGAISTEIADKVWKSETATDEMSKTYSYFKIGFGGEVVRLTKGFVYIYNPIVRWAYNFFIPRINTVPALKKRFLFGEG